MSWPISPGFSDINRTFSAADLYHSASLAVADASFKVERPNTFKHVTRLFQLRNQVAQTGRLAAEPEQARALATTSIVSADAPQLAHQGGRAHSSRNRVTPLTASAASAASQSSHLADNYSYVGAKLQLVPDGHYIMNEALAERSPESLRGRRRVKTHLNRNNNARLCDARSTPNILDRQHAGGDMRYNLL